MAVAGAEDDRFLLGSAGAQEQMEQVLAHFPDAVGHLQLFLERACLITPGQLAIIHLFAGQGVRDLFLLQVRLAYTGLFFGLRLVVQEDITLDHFTGSQVAVIHPLRHVIFIDRLAEIMDVVGCDLLVFRAFVPIDPGQLARCGGQADLDRLRVALQDQRPLAPGRAVALVHDDVGEIIFGIVVCQEAGI